MDHKVSKDMISSGMTPSGEKTQADLSRTQYGSAPSPSKLMDAYKSMYGKKEEVINEHHQKDADGKVIEHEDTTPSSVEEVKEENVDEAIVTGSILGGLALKKLIGGAALKFGGKALAKKALMMMAGKSAKAGLASKVGTGLNVANTGMIGKSVLMPPKIGTPKQAPQQKSNKRTAGTGSNVQFADVDLFDIVKGEIIAEGYDEKEAAQIMIELSKKEYKESLEQAVNEILQLDEISGSMLMRASRTADKARSIAARSGNTALAQKKAAQASKFYTAGAKKNIASQDLTKPLNPQRKDYPMGKGANYQQKPGM